MLHLFLLAGGGASPTLLAGWSRLCALSRPGGGGAPEDPRAGWSTRAGSAMVSESKVGDPGRTRARGDRVLLQQTRTRAVTLKGPLRPIAAIWNPDHMV